MGTLVGDVVRGLRGALVADGLGFVDDVLGGPVQVQLGDGAVGFFPDFPGFGVGLSDEADDAALGLRELRRLLEELLDVEASRGPGGASSSVGHGRHVAVP